MSGLWPLVALCVAALILTNWGWLLMWRARAWQLDWANAQVVLLQKNSGRWHNAFKVVSRDRGEGRSSGEWPAVASEPGVVKARALLLSDTVRLPKTPGMAAPLPPQPPALSEAQTIELDELDIEIE